MVEITINDKKIQAKEGELLIDVLLENGFDIPHFCYHKSLGIDGNCRMCMVEIQGQKRPQISCNTPVKAGQVINTVGEKIDKVKKSILELELINHPIDCPICDQAGECKLQDYYMDVGLYDSRLDTSKVKSKKQTDFGCNVMYDGERCVLCTRCVRFFKNIRKSPQLGVVTRSDHSYISTFFDEKLEDEYAMNVIDLCPVGALTSKDFRFKQRVWFLKNAKLICQGCSRGCNIYADFNKEKYKNTQIYRFRPRQNDKINGFFICDKGRLGYKKENEVILLSNKIMQVSSNYTQTLRAAKDYLTIKPAFLLSPSLSLEEMFMAKKVANKYSCNIYIYNKSLTDENFGDNFLKTHELSSNLNSAKILDIKIINNLPNEENFLCFNLTQEQINDIKNKPYGIFSSKNISSNAVFQIAIASFTQTFGSYINCDFYLQSSFGNISYNENFKSLIEVLSNMNTQNHDLEEIHTELKKLKSFFNINFKSNFAQKVKYELS